MVCRMPFGGSKEKSAPKQEKQEKQENQFDMSNQHTINTGFSVQ